MTPAKEPEKQKRVKGALVIDYIKIIKANPDRAWSDYLTPEDFEPIEQMILPSSWYPADMFQRMGIAIFKLVSREDYRVVRLFGRGLGQRISSEQPGLVNPGDPQRTCSKYLSVLSRFFSFPLFAAADSKPGRLEVKVISEPDDLGPRLILEATAGALEQLAELAGASEISARISDPESAGAYATDLTVSWKE